MMAEPTTAQPPRLEDGTDRQISALRGKLGVSRETLARIVDVSARTVERWEAANLDLSEVGSVRRLIGVSEIADLAQEVYGADGIERFLVTPRRSLQMRTPKEAMVQGDLEGVRAVLVNALEGHWA